MATYRITTSNSVTTNTNGDHAFDSDTPGADTLIVDAGAYLQTTGAASHGALLAATKGWKVKVDGSIYSAAADGIVLGSSFATSTITIGGTGEVRGDTGLTTECPTIVGNFGSIIGGAFGIKLTDSGALTLNNSGLVQGGTYSIFDNDGLSADRITNSGTLDGDVYLRGRDDILTNSDLIIGTVDAGDGNDKVTNSGEIRGSVYLREGNDRLVNSGLIKGDVDLGSGDTGIVINSGTIEFSVQGGTGNDTVTNSGNIGYSVSLGDGLNKLTNSGVIARDVFGGGDRDVVKNSGTIAGYVDLGGGDDSYAGGRYADYVADSAGSDSTSLGGGNDIYYARGDFNPADDGIDTIDGGAGYDVYDASLSTVSVLINLDNIAHDLSPLNPGAMPVAAGTASGAQLGTDKIRNFEEAIGGSGHDVIYGSASANVLEGGEGSDILFGFGGNDVLIGGEGDDTLAGGSGKDFLYSGAGYDAFVFTSMSDSGTTAAMRDAIMDFESGFDLIVLQPIDAIAINGTGDDTFNFIGSQSFTGVAGQLRVSVFAGGQIVEGDVNGDGKADFSIEVATYALTNTLTAADFLL